MKTDLEALKNLKTLVEEDYGPVGYLYVLESAIAELQAARRVVAEAKTFIFGDLTGEQLLADALRAYDEVVK